jgi:pimeloyl-ACP methyl ester carboxylesterase
MDLFHVEGDMDIRSGYTNQDGARLYFEEAGRGFPLVLVHTGNSDMRMWDEQFTIFAREYHTIRYDLRGHGQSELTNGHYSHADDLFRLLHYLKIECAFLLGCAMGASTTVDFAIEYGHMAAGLILVNPALSGFSDETQEGPVDFLPVSRLTIPPLNKIHGPVMVITGENDHPAMTATIGQINAAIPEVKKARLTDTALLPNIGKPIQFNRIVLTFLEWARENDYMCKPNLVQTAQVAVE